MPLDKCHCYGYYILDQLETSSNGLYATLSSTLAALGMPQPRAFESLKSYRDLGLGLQLLHTSLRS